VEEEFQQSCFHITVYRSYMPLDRRAKSELPRHTVHPALAQTEATPAETTDEEP
jgi:hypothetical protein